MVTGLRRRAGTPTLRWVGLHPPPSAADAIANRVSRLARDRIDSAPIDPRR